MEIEKALSPILYLFLYYIYRPSKYHVEPLRPHSKGKRIRKSLLRFVLVLVHGDYLTIYLVNLKGNNVG